MICPLPSWPRNVPRIITHVHSYCSAHYKPSVLWRSRCRCRRVLLKVPILSGTGVEFTQINAFAKNVSITLSPTILKFLKERAIIWNY